MAGKGWGLGGVVRVPEDELTVHRVAVRLFAFDLNVRRPTR